MIQNIFCLLNNCSSLELMDISREAILKNGISFKARHIFFKDHLYDFKLKKKSVLLDDIVEENTAGKRIKYLHKFRKYLRRIINTEI